MLLTHGNFQANLRFDQENLSGGIKGLNFFQESYVLGL